MSAPESDRAGVRQVIRALIAAGFPVVEVFDGEENVKVRNETEAVEAVMAVDDASVFFYHVEANRNPWVRFVLGNDPEEVAADWVCDLADFDKVVDDLTTSWWS